MQLCSSSSVQWIHNVSTIVADCVGLFFCFFFGEETKTNYCLGIRKVKYETIGTFSNDDENVDNEG